MVEKIRLKAKDINKGFLKENEENDDIVRS